MEFQYATLDTEVGSFTLIRVYEPEAAELAQTELFQEYFVEEVRDEDIVVIYRDPDGNHEFYGNLPIEFSDEDLDGMLWHEGEWYAAT